MKILYVEDNEDNVYLLRRRFAREAITLICAVTGTEGVQAALRELPDLILMDLDLPDIDGFEATRQLRQCTQTSAIPVIALSAGAQEHDRQRAIACGCDDYDTKPIDVTRLRGKILALLDRNARR